MLAPMFTVNSKCKLGHDLVVISDESGVSRKLAGSGKFHLDIASGLSIEIKCSLCAIEAYRVVKYHR